MTIVEINEWDTGSTGRIMFSIAEVARKEGFNVYTFSGCKRKSTTTPFHHSQLNSRFGFLFKSVLYYLLGNNISVPFFSTFIFIHRLKRIKPDIIHLHNIHGGFISNTQLFKYIKKNNIKTIWTLHDCWAFTGRCPHFIMEHCEKWKHGCHECTYPKDRYPATRFDRSEKNWRQKRKSFSGVSNLTLVTPSNWLMKQVKQSYLKDYPGAVIHNGIDFSVFSPKESRIIRERLGFPQYIIMGVASSWGKRKGLDVFIELSKKLPGEYKIVLVGITREERKCLPEVIDCVERTADQNELAEYYSAADLFVNPTREDTFPTVNIEALACGTPVLTFRTGGSPEIIDETCGAVVDCDDFDSLLSETIDICANKRYSPINCIRRAKLFSKEERFIDYIKLFRNEYESIIN